MILNPNTTRLFFVTLTSLLFLMVFLALIAMNTITQDILLFQKYYNILFYFAIFGVVVLLFIVLFNFFKIREKVKQKTIGAKLTWRMIKVVSLIVMIPSLLFYFFTLDAINRNIDNLHTVKIEETIQDTIDLSNASIETALLAYKRRTELLEEDILIAQKLKQNPVTLLDILRKRANAYELSLFTYGGQVMAMSTKDNFRILPTRPNKKVNKTSVDIIKIDGLGSYIQVIMPISIVNRQVKKNILLALYPISEKIAILREKVNEAKQIYARQDFIKEPLKRTFVVNMSLVLSFALFVTFWVVFRAFAKLVEPLTVLSKATKDIAGGNYKIKLDKGKNDDFGDLIQSFNQMIRKVEEASQELEEQRVYLETILKYSYGVITLDEKYNIKFINNVFESIVATKLQNIIGKPYKTLTKKQIELEPMVDLISYNFQNNIFRFKQEIVLTINGDKHFIYCQCVPLINENSNLGFVIVFNDVTDLNKAQRTAAWGEVAKRLAHEIKNPLTPIQLSAERLRRKFLGIMNKEDAKILDKSTSMIMNQVDSLKSMVGAFSEYAKSPKLNKELLQLNELIKQTLTLYENINFIEFIEDKSIPKIELDKDRIQRVLINLIKNAIEALYNTDNPKITIQTKLEKNKINLIIMDNGGGFSQDIKHNMFEPYVTTKEKGTGLGLAIIKKIVEEHEATIKINNENNGVKVVIIF
ncbi:Nitrogen regulation protein NtrY [hydrothermal vent metagenome]|uniref:histidine kinase n=1 Tax=hydrothermal vent metagenome TaxID=652676 RepID=A0A1W1CT41_9ZZZZ